MSLACCVESSLAKVATGKRKQREEILGRARRGGRERMGMSEREGGRERVTPRVLAAGRLNHHLTLELKLSRPLPI